MASFGYSFNFAVAWHPLDFHYAKEREGGRRGNKVKCESRKETFSSVVQATRPPNPCGEEREREYGRESVVEANAAGQKSTTYNPPKRKGDRERQQFRF